jgi:hypothetical protein
MEQQLHASKKKKSSCKEGYKEASKKKSSKEKASSKKAKSFEEAIIIQTSYEYRMMYREILSPYWAEDFLFDLTVPQSPQNRLKTCEARRSEHEEFFSRKISVLKTVYVATRFVLICIAI